MEDSQHNCLSCCFPITAGQAETVVKTAHGRATQYVHTEWEDCQAALRGMERVIWPSPMAKG